MSFTVVTDLPPAVVFTAWPVAGSYSVSAFATAWPSSPVVSVEVLRPIAS